MASFPAREGAGTRSWASFSARGVAAATPRPHVASPLQQGNVQLRTRWLPPNPPFYKVNIDASWTSNNRMGNVGVVIRDSGGNFVAAWKSNILAPRVEVAEALAVQEGCILAKELVFCKIIVESDSQEAILCLTGSIFNGRWETFPIFHKVIKMGNNSRSVAGHGFLDRLIGRQIGWCPLKIRR